MHYLPLDKVRLKRLIKACKHLNVFPTFLPHYFYKSEENPITEELLPLVEQASEYIEILSREEAKSLFEKLPPGIQVQIGGYGETEEEQLKRLALYVVVAEVQLRYLTFQQVVSGDLEDSEVLKVYPELKDKFDRDGLLTIDSDFTLLDGGIEYNDHILHYHQLLRRGFTSQPNFTFLVEFIKYYHESSATNDFRIAVDHNRIMPRQFYTRIFELDRWFGAPFDRTKLDDPNQTGLTVVKRNKNSLFDLDNQLDRTEFFWSHRRGIKTLQIEEVSDLRYQFDHYHFNRYVHSERDIHRQQLQHFDGAVKVYLADSYSRRLNSKMPNELKSHKKIKLFRIDGDIDVDSWLDLICAFYKSNEMIIQYFSPEHFEQVFDERVRDFKEWKRKQRND